jgi:hypothetical protein
MIQSLVKGLLGPSLAPLYDYVTTHPGVIGIALFIFVAIYVAGRFQLHNISVQTQNFVIERYKEEIQRRPNITPTGFYTLIYPEWATSLRKWGWFIPHRLDLWPILVTPDNVKDRIAFSSKWVAEILEKNELRKAK